jgi:hypothetical protein
MSFFFADLKRFSFIHVSRSHSPAFSERSVLVSLLLVQMMWYYEYLSRCCFLSAGSYRVCMIQLPFDYINLFFISNPVCVVHSVSSRILLGPTAFLYFNALRHFYIEYDCPVVLLHKMFTARVGPRQVMIFD